LPTEKAIPLAGFSSTRGHKTSGFQWYAKRIAR